MSLRFLPPHVRAHLYLFWAGAVAAGLGIVGFFLSFGEVGSPAQAAVDVHYEVPTLAYTSIAAWVVGMMLMWYGRRRINAAVARKLRDDRESVYVDLGLEGTPGADGVEAEGDEAVEDDDRSREER